MISAGSDLTYLGTMQDGKLNFLNTWDNKVITLTPEEANYQALNGNVTNAPTTAQTAAGGDAAEGASSSMDNLAQAQGAMSIASAAGSIATSIIGYCTAKDQMNFQLDSMTSQLEHQDKMAEKQMEMAKDQAYWQEKGISDKVEFQGKYFEAREGRAKAENQLAIAKARVAEKKKSEKAGKINTKALDRLFRTNYSYGKPMAA